MKVVYLHVQFGFKMNEIFKSKVYLIQKLKGTETINPLISDQSYVISLIGLKHAILGHKLSTLV